MKEFRRKHPALEDTCDTVCSMLGIFQADSPAWIGVAVLEFWCAYFCPVAILSLLYFWHKEENENV